MSSIVSTSRIAIVGLGQLGSSLAMAFMEKGCINLLAYARKPEVLQEAVNAKIIDAGSTDPSDILPVVDICFICLPLDATVSFVKDNIKYFRPGSIITDVGSVKGSIVSEIRDLLNEKGCYFIGSHPMAGTEKTGFHAGDKDLYKDCVCFLTPTADDDEEAIELLRTFWQEAGARVFELESDRHDQAVANCSHLLHLLAAIIAKQVLGEGDREAHELACAGGFRDSSRIAASDPRMWTEISRHNKDAVLQSLDSFRKHLDDIEGMLKDDKWDDLESYLGDASKLRQDWYTNFISQRHNEDNNG